ncbi:diguanylate cyclase [Lysobacter sp. SG-8]|uniref:Diguanylate cyclase n=1 Tax=Marilutibacter penaei TaxID=2759900 RepID=A0A7W3YF96_9GAMM|nr:diguanylate cyclase [Lysobacter penaei]MBB1089639.1 diguanylate cyclase [Lysobacter penaei]
MRIALALLLVVLAAAWPGVGGAQALKVELLHTEQDIATPPAVAPVQRRLVAEHPGDTVRLSLPRRRAGYWLRLTTDVRVAADQPLVLVLDGGSALGPVTFHPPGAPAVRVNQGLEAESHLLRRGWDLPLPQGWPAASVAYLRVNGSSSQPLVLGLHPRDEVILSERREARLSSAIFTTLMLMAIFMVGLWVAFRDLLYLSYAAYLVAIATYAMLLSGDAGEVPVLAWIDASGALGRYALATLAVALQLIFTIRFLELDRLMPRRARILHVAVWLHFVLLAILLVGRERVYGWFYLASNLLLVLVLPIAVVFAIQAWQRRASLAAYFLVGWTPLLLVVVMMLLHQFGAMDLPWAQRLLPLAAVLQSAVLALALSQHAANRHRITLLARQSAERDPLTGALNRHAVTEMMEAWSRIGHLGASEYGILLIDLDDFSEVNQKHGYVVGDTVMQQVLARIRGLVRPDDTVARMESDMFAVVSECHRDDCELLAHRLVDGFQRRDFAVDGHAITVTVSIGLAMSQRGEGVDGLLARAEAAMESARIAGHSSVGIAAETPGRRRRPVEPAEA